MFCLASRLALALCASALLAAAPVRAAEAMPLVEMASASPGDTLVVFYSGDGGWAALDAGVARGFVRAGLPVVGVNSLRYFMAPRTPQGAAEDLGAIITRYSAQWRRPRVILVGYSFGAAALPAIVARLRPEERARVRLLALVNVGARGKLRFQPGDWLDRPAADAYPLAPVLAGLGGVPRVCVFGDRDPHDACATFGAAAVRPIRLPGGHHFGGGYAPVSAAILRAAGL